jgi:L-ascorbate metabolism protein UlaG (beta-lactamase superfamily)
MKKIIALALACLCSFGGVFSASAADSLVNDTATIQQIRNATLKISYGGKRFLVDPMFAPKNSFGPVKDSFNPFQLQPLVDLPVPVKELLDVDAVILTHLHGDHFDEAAIKALPKDIKIFTQDEIDAKTLRGHGFTNLEILKYTGNKFGDVTIIKTDCVHGEKESTMPYYEQIGIRWEASGFILKHSASKIVYVAGDTIWSDPVKYALRFFNPDVVVLNAADAQFLTSGSIIMGLKDIAEVIRETPEETKIIASHLDTVGHAMIGRKEIRQFVKDYNLAAKVLIPEDGESLTF